MFVIRTGVWIGLVVFFLTACAGASTIDVDLTNPVAADYNPGTAAAPLKTIGEAARRAVASRQNGISSEVVIHPGIYRESVQISGSQGDSAASIIVRGTGNTPVIISGADVMDGWHPGDGRDIYQHAWPHRFGEAALPAGFEPVADDLRRNPIVLRSEMIFQNGQLLRQVMSLDKLHQTAASFFVDESQAVISLHVSAGTDSNHMTIEAAVRPGVFESFGIHHLTLRNLTIMAAASPIQRSALQIGGETDVHIEGCTFDWNNWNGLGIAESNDVTLKNISADHNGASGFGAWRVKDLVVDKAEASFNNWRGDWGGFRSWATGQKFFSVHGARFDNYTAHDNLAPALWFDTDNTDIVVEHATLDHNCNQGLFLEASQGPLTFRNCTITRNGETGVLGTHVANVTLDYCNIAGNGRRQIFIPGFAPENTNLVEPNFETKQLMQLRCDHWTLTDNTIAAEGNAQLMVISNWPWFIDTFKASGNAYRHADRSHVFGMYPSALAEPAWSDLAGWQSSTKQDANAVFNRMPLSANLRRKR